jgi:flagellar assembly factor FliW
MTEIITTRFGAIPIDESRVIEMQGDGILGFETLRRFVLILHKDEKTPFMWLQSVEDGATAFVVLDAFAAMPDYSPLLDDDTVTSLGIEEVQDVVLLTIVTIRSNPLRVTANLRAPVVISAKRRRARQVVIEQPDYPIQYDLALRAGGSADSTLNPILGMVKGITTAVAG